MALAWLNKPSFFQRDESVVEGILILATLEKTAIDIEKFKKYTVLILNCLHKNLRLNHSWEVLA